MESLVYVGMDVHKDTYSLCCYAPKDGDFFPCVFPKAVYKKGLAL